MSDALRLPPEVTISLTQAEERLSGWQGLQIQRQIDAACDAYSFAIPFDPTPENRERFRPFKATQIRIRYGEQLVLTGYIEKVGAVTGAGERMLNIQGRSVTGGLLDWSAGPPFEYWGLTLRQIAEQAAAIREIDGTQRVALTVRVRPDTPVIEDASINVGDTIYGYLSGLAQANGLWALPQADGSLLFSRLDSNRASVVDLQEGVSPLLNVSADYDVTKRFQRYMVVASGWGYADAQFEIPDIELLGIGVRGRQITELDKESWDLQQAAIMARSKAIIDSFTVSATVQGWAVNGRLWTPGDIIRLQAPGAFIQDMTRLIIKQATLALDEQGGQVANLELTLPEAYNQAVPRNLPWLG